ncbi:MAG: hypothetical protein Q9222_003811 [Ikaeria aurantiellina]
MTRYRLTPGADSSQGADGAATDAPGESEAHPPKDIVPTVELETADTDAQSINGSIVDRFQEQLHLNDSRLNSPSTTRELYDATPRASPSPSPEQRSGHRNSNGNTTSNGNQAEQTENDLATGMQQLRVAHELTPYSVRDEALPSEPFFNKDFHKCLKSGREIAKNVHEGLSACSLATQNASELSRLRATAERLMSFESPASRLIGIVGDSAAGKSSLINSLLNIPDLAHRGDHGSAVTTFVTEYHRRMPQHTAPYTVEVEYCSQEETEDQLHELLYSYRELYQPGLQNDLKQHPELYDEIEKKSEVALSTLQSIFPESPEVTPAHLQSEEEDAFRRILDELKGLAKSISWPAGAVDGKWHATASNTAACHDQVALFMRQGLWPLTNVVRIYLSAQVLKTGVVLVDLPDLPLAKGRYASVTASAAGRAAIDDLEVAWEKSAAEMQMAETRFVSVSNLSKPADDPDIKHSVRNSYAKHAAGLNVKVFCVGNRDYEGFGYRCEEARDHAVRGSCIPELRRFCHSVVAQAQYRASMHFLEVELPTLIRSCEVWLDAADQESSTVIDPQIVTTLQSALEQGINEYAEGLEQVTSTNILNTINMGLEYVIAFRLATSDLSQEDRYIESILSWKRRLHD